MSLFSFESVSFAFGNRQVLNQFSLTINRGDKTVLKGASGCGKSTLLKSLLGFCRPDFGEIRYLGKRLEPETVRRVRTSVAYLGQSTELQSGSVRNSVNEIFELKTTRAIPDEEELSRAFDEVGLHQSCLSQNVHELSGGERQRVFLAVALLLNRSIFLLDEPTAALDADLKAAIADLFLNHPEWTVIVAAHDPVWFENRNVTLIDLDR